MVYLFCGNSHRKNLILKRMVESTQIMSHLTCGICLDTAIEAVESECCHQIFCQRCFCMIKNEKCPLRRNEEFICTISYIPRRLIQDIKAMKARQLNRRVIETLAIHIVRDWKRLSRILNIPESTIEHIDRIMHGDTYEKAIQSLLTWKSINLGSWDVLKEALCGIPRYDIIRFVENLVRTEEG